MTTCTKFVKNIVLGLILPGLMLCFPLPASAFSGLTVFGDSLSDQGNSGMLIPAEVAPYYYEGRWSNGPVWVEYLASGLGVPALQANPSASGNGSNYAFGGSTTGPETAYYPVPDLLSQVGNFSLANQASPDAAIQERLFVIWSGGNDVINHVETAGGILADPAVMAGNIVAAMEGLYAEGARSFLIPNLPPLGFKPDFSSDPVLANSLVDAFNFQLALALDELESEHGDLEIFRLDIHGLVNGILADPAAYGLSNVTGSALVDGSLDPNSYLFWDNTHPTTAGHQIIANEALNIVPEPGTVVLAVLGLGLVLLRMGWGKRMGRKMEVSA